MSQPQYRRAPELYAFNTTTQRHMLRSSVAFKRLFKKTPEIFVDTRLKLLEETGPIQLPLAPTPEIPSPAVHVGEPLPTVPQQTILTVSENQDDAMRQQVRYLIQAELKQNPAPYTAKSADEMSVLFRQMLVAKLLKVDESAPATKKPATKPPPKAKAAKKPLFKIRAPQTSEDEDDHSSDSEL